MLVDPDGRNYVHVAGHVLHTGLAAHEVIEANEDDNPVIAITAIFSIGLPFVPGIYFRASSMMAEGGRTELERDSKFAGYREGWLALGSLRTTSIQPFARMPVKSAHRSCNTPVLKQYVPKLRSNELRAWKLIEELIDRMMSSYGVKVLDDIVGREPNSFLERDYELLDIELRSGERVNPPLGPDLPVSRPAPSVH